jgi:hypothetical protein
MGISIDSNASKGGSRRSDIRRALSDVPVSGLVTTLACSWIANSVDAKHTILFRCFPEVLHAGMQSHITSLGA